MVRKSTISNKKDEHRRLKIIALVLIAVVLLITGIICFIIWALINSNTPVSTAKFNSINTSQINASHESAVNKTENLITNLNLGGTIEGSSREDFCYQGDHKDGDFPDGFTKVCIYDVSLYIGYTAPAASQVTTLEKKLNNYYSNSDTEPISSTCYLNPSLFGNNVDVEYLLLPLPVPAATADNDCDSSIEPYSQNSFNYIIGDGDTVHTITYTQEQPVSLTNIIQNAKSNASQSLLEIQFVDSYFDTQIK